MKQTRWALIVLVSAVVLVLSGCGRPSLPGKQFAGGRVSTSTSPESTAPIPENPVLEFGSQKARVRIVAFFAIDKDHQKLIDLLKSLASRYQGKVYVKYVDYRSPRGQQMMSIGEQKSIGLSIDGQGSVTIEAKPLPYEADFGGEMGRYWTSKDLEIAVAQEVAKVYGK